MNKKAIYDLYYGNITPCDINLKKHPKLIELNQEMLKLMNQIENILGEKNLYIFDNYNDIINKQYTQLQCISFQDGFKLGLKLAVEALYEDEKR